MSDQRHIFCLYSDDIRHEVNGKVSLIAALTPDLTKRLHAGKIAQAVAKR